MDSGPIVPREVAPTRYYYGPKSETKREGWPTVFFAFSHNPHVEALTQRMRDDLARLQVDAYRALDNKRPGESLTARIHQAIDAVDAVVIFYSNLASKSAKVRDEYDYAKRIGKRPCLIVFEGVPLPDDWDPDIQYLPIRGAIFPGGLMALVARVNYNLYEWPAFVEDVAAFARRAAADRRGGVEAH